MILNTNLPAINANRNLNGVNQSKSTSLSKLSSGLRINKAADDSAGLAISEKMRAQIRGLDRANQNCQEGVSLIQTAEGGIDSIQNMMKRLKELAVQAANDSNTDKDRALIQKEVDQILEGIDEIASNTEFNTLKLLDGSLSGLAVDPLVLNNVLEYLNGSWITDALSEIQARTGLTFNQNVNLTVKFEDLGSGGVVAQMASSSNNTDYVLSFNTRFLANLTPADFGTPSGPPAGRILLDRLITHETMHALSMHNDGATWGDQPLWFIEGLAEAVHGASDIRFGDFFNLSDITWAQSLINNFTPTTGGMEAYTTGYLAVSYLDNLSSTGVSGAGSGMVTTLLDNLKTMDFGAAIQATYGMTLPAIITQMKNEANSNMTDFLANKCKIGISDGLADALGDQDASDVDIIANNPGTPLAIDPSLQDTKNVNGNDITIYWPDTAAATDGFILHIGANSNQQVSLTIPSMKSGSIFGQNSIYLGTQLSAEMSIKAIDDGFPYVASARTALGAMQNQLDFRIGILSVSSLNTSSAESQLRDINMAKEMVNFTKIDIISQVATTMLSQANQNPNKVLELLQ